ncbi:MAG TPA: hypothetical protein VFV08_04265 [Puia sp.]|nr:hypothetical protein [Puia sp.]
MELQFTLEGDRPAEKAIALKSFIEEHKLDGVQSVEVERGTAKAGDQGIATAIGSVITKIVDSSGTIKGIVQVISKFLELFDGRIIINNNKGEKIVIPGGKKLSSDQIEKIALQFSNH